MGTSGYGGEGVVTESLINLLALKDNCHIGAIEVKSCAVVY